jgi:hypothetical protein
MPRIHAHKIESLNQVGRKEGLGIGDVLRSTIARAAGVEEKRAYALLRVLGRPSRDSQGNRCSRGLGPINWHLESIATLSVPHWVCGDCSHADQAILKPV